MENNKHDTDKVKQNGIQKLTYRFDFDALKIRLTKLLEKSKAKFKSRK
jgi:hypothetical protein